MTSLSQKSKTLLEMIDDLVEASPSYSSKKSPHFANEILSVSQDFPPSHRLSDQMKTYLKQSPKVPKQLQKELIQNQEKIDSIIEQNQSPQNPQKKATKFRSEQNLRVNTSYFNNTPNSRTKYLSPYKIENDTEITISNNELKEIPNTEKSISELEFRLSLAEQSLKQEREIREFLLSSLNKTVSAICEKCVSIKPGTTKNISQMLSRMNSTQAKLSTARLLDQEITSMLSEIPSDEQFPSPILKTLSPRKNSATPEFDVLVRGCNELADSLADGFYTDKIGDFGELAKTPIEFARQVNQLKKAHDVGIAELRAQIEVLSARAEKLEEMEERGHISEETTALVENLTQMIQDFSVQSRTEYEDLIENME